MKFRSAVYPVFQILQSLGWIAILLALAFGGMKYPDLIRTAKMELALALSSVSKAPLSCVSVARADQTLVFPIGQPTELSRRNGVYSCGGLGIQVTRESVKVAVWGSQIPLIEPIFSARPDQLRLISPDQTAAEVAVILPVGTAWIELPAGSRVEISPTHMDFLVSKGQMAHMLLLKDKGVVAADRPFGINVTKGTVSVTNRNLGSTAVLLEKSFTPVAPPALAWLLQGLATK